jgi:hypothetical protein
LMRKIKTVRMFCIMVGSVLAAFLVPLAARAWLPSPRPVEAPVMAADWDYRQRVSANLTQTIGMHFYPAMAAQGENVYAMWSKLAISGTTNYDPYYNQAGNYGGLAQWNSDTAVRSTPSDYDTVNVDMAVDDTGGLHFVWTEATGTPHNYTLYYSYNATSEQEIMGSDDEVVPAIAVGNSLVHVVWSQRSLEGSSDRYDIMYRSKDSGWSISTTVRSSYDDPVGNPAIAVDGSGRVHVAWNEGDPGSANILYKNSSSNWSGTPVTLSSNVTNESHGPALTVSGENVYAVWCERQDGDHQYVRFAQSTGRSTWFLMALLVAVLMRISTMSSKQAEQVGGHLAGTFRRNQTKTLLPLPLPSAVTGSRSSGQRREVRASMR